MNHFLFGLGAVASIIIRVGVDNMDSLYNNINYVHKIFEYWAAKSPNSIALSYEAEQLTYSELNLKANQIAHYLIKVGIRPGDLIGLCCDSCLDLMAALLAILKVGAAYVPLDSTHPLSRISNILNDVDPKLTIIDERTKNKITATNVLNLSEMKEKICLQSIDNPSVDEKKIDLCYIIYVSLWDGNNTLAFRRTL